MTISRAFLLLLYFVTLSIAVIDVPITVKDTSGHGSPFGFPTSVVIPLPYGEFQTTTSFRMTDSAGSSVPSQFNIQTRWADKDNSIREVVVHFSPSVDSYTGPGTGVSVYHFRTDGSGDLAPSTNAITVTESTDLWTVSNGLISIEVAKKNFTTLSNLKLNGQDLLTSSGGVLMDRLGNVQSDAQLPIYSAEIEENGPMRVVLKVTALTVLPQCQQFKSDSCDGFTKLHCEDGEVPQVQHGFAVRIYAYANQSFVKIDYQLQNSQYSDMIYGYPLYFDELRLDFSVKLNSGASTVTIGKGDGTTWTNSLTSNGWQLYQDVPTKNGNVFRIRDAKSKSPSFSGAESDGFVDVSDTTGGVLAFIRNFWQSWPNAIKTSIQDQSNVNLSVELFPSDGTMLGYYGNVSNTGIYWLDDMQHVYKEVYLYAHDSQVSTEEKIAMATRFQWFPVAVVPANWYRDTSVTLDMGGYIPSQEDPIDYDDQRTLVTEQANDVTGEYSNFETYLYPFHWRHFGATDSGYRDSSCTTGGTPYSVGRYVVTGSPVDYFRALDRGVGELNTRPQWMSPNYRFNESGAFNSPGAYCGNSWRYFCNLDQNVAPRLPDTNGIINPRDDQHGWFHYVLESYSITGNLWIKDWYKFIGEFRKSRLYEGAVPFPDLSSRGTGHAFAHAVQAFRATGDKSIAEGLKYNIRAYRRPYIDPRWGTNLYSIESNGGGYQTGYYCRAIINWLEETSDPQAWAEGFQLVAALVNYNQKLSHFAYYWQPDDNPANSYSASASGSETNADPVAWYYYHTGIEEYRKIVVQFQETGVPGFDGANEVPGGLPYEDLRSTWTGSFIGRLTKDLFNETFMSHDTRPNKIEDLGAWVDGSVKLAWTTPSNAVKFHFVWSTQRISEEHTLDPNITNWWAANVVGTSLVAVPGSRQTISFDGLTGVSDYYVAMFTWDSIGNMSPMSNVAVSVNGPFPGVTGGPSTTAGSGATGPNGDNGNDADVSIGDVCQVSVAIVILSCLINVVFY